MIESKASASLQVAGSKDFPMEFPVLEQPDAANQALAKWWFDFRTVLLRNQVLLEQLANNTEYVTSLQTQLTALSATLATINSTLTAIDARLAIVEGGSTTTTSRDPIKNVDVDIEAGIEEQKLALNFPTHSDANDPTAGEKAALAGTDGAPGAGNKYVTDSDPRIPSTDEKAALAGTVGTPSTSNKYVTDADTRVTAGSDGNVLSWLNL